MPAALLALAVLLLPLVAADPADHVGVRRIGGATQVIVKWCTYYRMFLKNSIAAYFTMEVLYFFKKNVIN